MKHFLIFVILISMSISMQGQSFNRAELDTPLNTPWEIIYGPDDFLWLTERGGKVSRVNPTTGEKTEVYTAPDYFAGSPLEILDLCPELPIGIGTLGMALHPNFTTTETAFIYFVYSYNSGTEETPATKFRIKRLTWDASLGEVIDDTNIVNELTTGFDHLGGRLMAIKQGGEPYLILTIGDNGRSENSGDCYAPQSTNPNNFTQDISTQNGKIHRFNMDGSIPDDNPVAGNSFYTRGHRNPQGLMYNPDLEILYNIEHGNRTDDEINILQKGMNYGWKAVRGYHDDESYEGEEDFVANYVPHSQIPNDALVEPLYSWCTTPATSSVWTDWCTVAPSGGIYYGSEAIPAWENSLLVVTLKDGVTTDKEVYQFKLQDNGQLEPSTLDNPNPKRYFAEDQDMNGRLRDIAVSTDGNTIYLINNGGAPTSKITVYTYDDVSNVNTEYQEELNLIAFPNPATNMVKIKGLDQSSNISKIQISSLLGQTKMINLNDDFSIDVSEYPNGIYFLHIDLDLSLIHI